MKSFIEKLINNHIYVSVQNDNLKVRFEGEKIADDILSELKERKSEVISFLKHQTEKHEGLIKPTVEKQAYELSFSQKSLWMLSQFDLGTEAYHMPSYFELEGNYDIPVLIRAIEKTIDRHEILRTIFKEDNKGEVKQWVFSREDSGFEVVYHDVSTDKNYLDNVKNYIVEDSYSKFDLKNGPLIKVALFQISEKRVLFYCNMHHIISDGWSLGILTRDVFFAYQNLSSGKKAYTDTLKIQYKDYAAWQVEQQMSGKLNNHREYWIKKLAGELSLMDFPNQKPRPKVKSFKGCSYTTAINEEKTTLLKSFCIHNGGSLFTGLLTLFNALFYKYLNQEDIIIGTPVAGREYEILKNQIGFYANTIVFRETVAANDSFQSLFSKVNKSVKKGITHQSYPFERLVDDLKIKRENSRNPIFDVMFVFQNGIAMNHKESKVTEYINLQSKTSKFDLLFSLETSDNQISFFVEFNDELYNRETIIQFVTHYQELLKNAVLFPTKPLSELSYITATDKEKYLTGFNKTLKKYPKTSVLQLFKEQVIQNSNKTALVFEDNAFSYDELDKISNQWAHYLCEHHHIKTGDTIGVLLRRSELNVLLMLAIMKTGCIYVPINASYPSEHINYILKDALLKVLLTEELDTKQALTTNTIVDVRTIDLLKYSKLELPHTQQYSDTAFIIYTSGSTGKPKGVMQSHTMLNNLIHWQINDSEINTGVKHLQYASFSFDVSVQDIWSVFGGGGILYVANEEIRLDFAALSRYITTHKINTLSLPFSVLDKLFNENTSSYFKEHELQYIISSGEQLIVNDHLLSFLENNEKVELHNHYGPSETHVVTSYVISYQRKNLTKRPYIGKPIANNKIYVLSDALKLQPEGVIGQICVSGSGLGLGYVNNKILTDEKFIINPFDTSEKLYLTGDLGKWENDGTLTYLGRKDTQVKIRGYRVELGEIEATIRKFSKIIKGVVVVPKTVNAQKVLAAYYTSDEPVDREQLRRYMQSSLPEYMLPNYLVSLSEIPLTSNGKINRKGLPEVTEEHLIKKEYISAKTTIEKELVSIWSEVLGVTQIGITDNFFELGGHSLIISQLINKITKRINKKLSFRDVFNRPTIVQLANLLEVEEYIEIPKAPILDSYPLTTAQYRFWFLSQLKEVNLSYNMPGILVMKGDLNVNVLETSFKELIMRYEILRTIFKLDNSGTVRQYILSPSAFKFKLNYYNFEKVEDVDSQIKSIINKKLKEPFILDKGPLISTSIFKKSRQEHILFFSQHHIISDGWSIQLLISEVIETYNRTLSGKPIRFPDLRIQYKDYAVWQEKELQKESFKLSRNYWLKQFSGTIPILELPSFKHRPKEKTYNGAMLTYTYSTFFLEKLKVFSQLNNVTLFMTLMAGINALLSRYSGQKDIILGTPIAGREHTDLENQLGVFLNTLAIRTKISKKENFLSLLNKQRKILLDAYEHQDYPFDKLISELNLRRDSSRSLLFDVLVIQQSQNQLNFAKEEPKLNMLTIFDYEFESKSSKFDLVITINQSDSLEVLINYNTDIFHADLIESIFLHLQNLLEKAIESPELNIEDIDYLTYEEKNKILIDFNYTDAPLNGKETIIEEFHKQVLKAPNDIALIYEEERWTYSELNNKSNQFGYYLIEKYNINSGDFVAISLDRGISMIVSILGILKLGAAYIPIDLGYPKERVNYILEHSKAKIHLDYNRFLEFEKIKEQFLITNLQQEISTDSIAYIIYTSGTTGNPKGVLIKHCSVINLINSQKRTFNMSDDEVILQFSNYAFDASVEQMFLALLNGFKLLLIAKDIITSLDLLSKKLVSEKVTHFHATPSYLKLVMHKIRKGSLKRIIAGGEECSPEIKNELVKYATFYNKYGPSEATVTAIMSEYSFDDKCNALKLPIGKPIDNTKAYILSSSKQLQPIGVIGELCLSGIGLSSGYLNNEKETEDKFISNPFNLKEKLYLTGDLVRWLPDGNIEYIGRKGTQIKIRGYRIELGEIESVIQKFSKKIIEAIAEIKTVNNQKIIVGYYSSQKTIDNIKLREYLELYLPNYMVPNYFVQLSEIPLTLNGKTDRQRLPSPTDNNLIQTDYIKPKTNVEIEFVRIWQEHLKVPRIGIIDNFFDIGGNSLIAIKLIYNLRHIYPKLKLTDLYNYPTIKGLLSENKKTSLVIPLSKFLNDKQKVIYFIPPIIGIPTVFKELSDLLREEYNSYGLTYLGVGKDQGYFESIEDAGALFSREIQNNLSGNESEIIIFGYSMGGSIAFEIVKHLEKKYPNIRLMLVDSYVSKNTILKKMNQIEVIKDVARELNIEINTAFKDYIINNMTIHNNYIPQDKIRANVNLFKAEDNHNDIMKWNRYIIGKVSFDTIKGDHWEALNSINHSMFKDRIFNMKEEN